MTVGNGVSGHRLLDQAVEEFSPVTRQTPIESKGEFVEVVPQLFAGNPSLMDTQEPPFRQGSYAVDPGQKGRGVLRTGACHTGPVDISEIGEAQIGRPAVRDDHSPRHHRFFHEAEQTLSGGVWDSPEPYTTDPTLPFGLHSYGHQRLRLPELSSTFARFDPSYKGLIYLCPAPPAVSAGADHGTTQLVKAGPRRSVTPEAQGTLEARSAHAAFLVGDRPHRPEPDPQGNMAPVEDGPRCRRNVSLTSTALQESTTCLPGLTMTTARAPEAIGPPQPDQIIPTFPVRREPTFQTP